MSRTATLRPPHAFQIPVLEQEIRPAPNPAIVPADALGLIQYWWQAGPLEWFAARPEFDRDFRERFLALYERGARGELDGWTASAYSTLALLLILDQFPRNAFRGSARMYATDARALEIASAAVDKGQHRLVHPILATFFHLPFAHAEDLATQDRSVDIARELGPAQRQRAEHHRDIIRRFGRFPHRNPILGRAMRPEEQTFLDDGGYAG